MKRARPPPAAPLGAPPSTFQINALLLAAPSAPLLLQLTEQHGAGFNGINLATALHRLARLAPALPPEAAARLAALSTAVQARSHAPLNPRTLCALLHGVSALRLGAQPHLAALSATCARFLASGGALDGGALSSLLLCMARLGWTPAPAHLPLGALCAAAAAAAPRMSPVELSNAALGAARCRLGHAPLWAALAAAAGAQHLQHAPQGVATLAWAFAKARIDMPEPVGSALGRRALDIFKGSPGSGSFTAQDVAYLAYALARGCSGPRPVPALWHCIATYLSAPPQPISAASLFPLLASLTSAEAGTGEGEQQQQQQQQQQQGTRAMLHLAAEALCARCLALVTQPQASGSGSAPEGGDLGVLCTALLRGYGLPGGGSTGTGTDNSSSSSSSRQALARALRCALDAKAESLSWRSVGVGDAALRLLGGGEGAGSSSPALSRRALACSEELGAASDAANSAPGRVFSEHFPAPLCACASVLLCGRDSGGLLRAALAGRGIQVHHWHRFAEAEEALAGGSGAALRSAAAPWPALQACTPPPTAAIICYPSSKEDFEYTCAAAASHLPQGCPVYVLATGSERLHASPFEAAMFASPLATCAHSSGADGARILVGALAAPAPTALQRWGGTCTLASSVFSPPLPAWHTFPGLFAGGRLDAMSSALLCVAQSKGWVSALPGGAHVMDAYCGSGVLAAGVLRLAAAGAAQAGAPPPQLHLTLCDADALALHAARLNLQPPAAALHAVHCCFGMPQEQLLAEHSFACIVSNPPVHSGGPDDLRHVTALLRCAARALRRGGALLCVAQAHVAVGAIASGLCLGALDITQVLVGQGHFIVWRIVFA